MCVQSGKPSFVAALPLTCGIALNWANDATLTMRAIATNTNFFIVFQSTGDLPTPIKYNNQEIMAAYHEIEDLASEKLLRMLPPELQSSFEPIMIGEAARELHPIVKAADKLSAYIKCIEERKAGNNEFLSAEKQTRESLLQSDLPEVKYFMENFIPAFEKTLDELGTMKQGV